MEIKSTKDKIIYESLLLFSRDGFDATSTRAIARAIDCSDAVIYKHFKSKQEILDAILETCSLRLLSRYGEVNLEKMKWSDVEKICMGMFEFQTTDEWVVPFRRLLIIEQYKNDRIKDLYREIFITKPLENMASMFEQLINLGYMKPGNPMVYAMDLYSPFFMFHTVGGDNEKLLQTLKEHIALFRINSVSDPAILNQGQGI